jgi:hypothetical protein
MKSGNAHFRCTGSQLNAVFQLINALDLAEMLPALGGRRPAPESEDQQSYSDAPSKPCHVHPPGN